MYYKHFYCIYDEPSYNKYIKLDIMPYLVSDDNLGDILNELSEYATDVDTDLGCHSIQSLCEIALHLEKHAKPIIKKICQLVGMKQSHISNSSMLAFSKILRRYADQEEVCHADIAQIVPSTVGYVTEPESKASLIWVLGELGHKIDESVSILEVFLEEILEGSEDALCVKL